MKNRKIKGGLIGFWALVFVHLETIMFGSNLYPKTIAELICDGIGFAIFLLGGYYFFTNKP